MEKKLFPKKFFLAIASSLFLFSLIGCTSASSSSGDEQSAQLSSDSLLLQDSGKVYIDLLPDSDMVFDSDVDQGYCLVKFDGRVKTEALNFEPKLIRTEGENIWLTSDNPQKLNDRETLLSEDLGRSYSFESNPEDPSFEVVVRVAASLEETQGLLDNPAKL